MSETLNLINPPEVTISFSTSDVTLEMPGASSDTVIDFVGVPAVTLNFIEQAVTLNFPADGGGNNGGGFTSPSPTTIENGTTVAIPAGKVVYGIAIVPESGDRVLTVGYSAGQGEVIGGEDVYSDDGAMFLIGRYYHVTTTLHFSGFEGSVLIYIL